MVETHRQPARRRRFRGIRAAAFLPALALCTLTAWAPEPGPLGAEPAQPAFREIWAYLMRGEESRLTGTEPITDLCYFSASLNREGRIPGSVARPSVTLKDGLKPAIHLVIAELSSQPLMHFAMDPRYGVRPLLIEDICRVAADFDGVQIDFESVSRDDREAFFGFLGDLKSRLPADKKLSIAVPARTRLVADAYEYARIAAIVDRMVVMAYDEHWSGSEPGPVASLPWCAKVVDYARGAVDPGKIVMGLPLYGRAWQDKRLATALRFENVRELLTETDSEVSYASESGPSFSYAENVLVTVFYDDARSIGEKLALYRDRGIASVSFWRVGQGPPELWSGIENATPADAPDAPAAPAPADAPAADDPGEAALPGGS
jgi:spore germination protein